MRDTHGEQGAAPAFGTMSERVSFILTRLRGKGLNSSGNSLLSTYTAICFTLVDSPVEQEAIQAHPTFQFKILDSDSLMSISYL